MTNKWSLFDFYAREAARLRREHWAFLRKCDILYGTRGEYRRLAGGHCESWPAADKERSRNMIAAYVSMQDLAIRKRPKYVRSNTVRTRLHSIMNSQGSLLALDTSCPYP